MTGNVKATTWAAAELRKGMDAEGDLRNHQAKEPHREDKATRGKGQGAKDQQK